MDRLNQQITVFKPKQGEFAQSKYCLYELNNELNIPDSFALTYGRTIAIATNRRRSSLILFTSSILVIIDYGLVVLRSTFYHWSQRVT